MKEPNQDELRKMLNGVKYFAWIPSWSKWTGWFWLRHYWIFYSGGRNPDGNVFVWSGSPEDFRPLAKAVFLNETDALIYKLQMQETY